MVVGSTLVTQTRRGAAGFPFNNSEYRQINLYVYTFAMNNDKLLTVRITSDMKNDLKRLPNVSKLVRAFLEAQIKAIKQSTKNAGD